MAQVISKGEVIRVATLELNALRFLQVLDGNRFERARLVAPGTPVYDINGEVLFHRFAIEREKEQAGYADIAVNDVFAEPLLAVSSGQNWDEQAIKREARAAAEKHRRRLQYDEVRFVAYSFPKIAVQFLSDGKEVLMLEWVTWQVVPPSRKTERPPMHASNFERWSLIDELPAPAKRRAARALRARLAIWTSPRLAKVKPTNISINNFVRLSATPVKLVSTRDLHYSRIDTDHHVCYELRGQLTNVWCVAASAEMLLNFYRYEYDQERIAADLGLGTLTNPNGLPNARVGDVETVIENLTNLDATMITNPTFNNFSTEIDANRPLISIIPGHARTVGGYIRNAMKLQQMKIGFTGLLVYDPWPPTTGVITRWENFATQTYLWAFSASIEHQP